MNIPETKAVVLPFKRKKVVPITRVPAAQVGALIILTPSELTEVRALENQYSEAQKVIGEFILDTYNKQLELMAKASNLKTAYFAKVIEKGRAKGLNLGETSTETWTFDLQAGSFKRTK